MTTLDDAIRKLEQGRLKEGQRMLERLRKEDPDNPALLYNLGICYSEQGQLEASIEALERYGSPGSTSRTCRRLTTGYERTASRKFLLRSDKR